MHVRVVWAGFVFKLSIFYYHLDLKSNIWSFVIVFVDKDLTFHTTKSFFFRSYKKCFFDKSSFFNIFAFFFFVLCKFTKLWVSYRKGCYSVRWIKSFIAYLWKYSFPDRSIFYLSTNNIKSLLRLEFVLWIFKIFNFIYRYKSFGEVLNVNWERVTREIFCRGDCFFLTLQIIKNIGHVLSISDKTW